MADFSIIGQVYQFQIRETIKYDHVTLSRHHFNTSNDCQNFTAFTGGSHRSFSELILLKFVIFSQLNDFNEPKFIIQQQ